MIKTLQATELKCYHCGDACKDDQIHLEEKIFCCEGCKTVYEILNENSLCEYYELEKSPGNKGKEKSNEYAFLDEEKIKNDLLNFQEGTSAGVTFYIPSVHCSSCIWLLENLHKIRKGILSSSIHFQKKELEIRFDSSLISLREIATLLDTLGYAPCITLNGKQVTNKSVDKSLLYKIGIAGFCFGNIMLLSIPDYVAFFDFEGDFKTFFSYLNFLLAVPVFVYGASDYFVSAFNAIKNKMINIDLPIALGLVAAFSQSAYEIFSYTGTGYFDSLTGLIFFLLVGKWYQKKTYEALSFERDYKSYFPLSATLLCEGKERYVPLNELKLGDKILIRNQEVIPADGIVRSGNASIDYSFVTGESAPVEKNAGERIFAGGRQVGASIHVEVTKEVSESYLTQLWNRDQSKTKTRGLTDFTNKVGKYFTVAVIIISAITYLFWYGRDSSIALYSAVSVLIIFCPCTLALAIPFCFGNAMNILGKKGFFLKNTDTIEKLASNDTIVLDKTGTLTYAGNASVDFEGFLSPKEIEYIKSLTKNSIHPLSKILFNYLQGPAGIKISSFSEEISKGISGVCEQNLVKIGSAEFSGVAQSKKPLEKSSQVFVSINNEVKGCFRFRNKYRTGIEEVLNDLSHNYKLHLLSGDNDSEKQALKDFFSYDNIHFNQSPSDKMDYVRKLQRDQKVLMIGDGLNDAGALMESNCAISISENSANFSPACDAILEADKLSKLPAFLAFSKACVKTVQLSLLVSLTYNITGLFFACQGMLKPLVAAILMPLSSVSIVLFVILMSNILAKKYRLK